MAIQLYAQGRWKNGRWGVQASTGLGLWQEVECYTQMLSFKARLPYSLVKHGSGSVLVSIRDLPITLLTAPP